MHPETVGVGIAAVFMFAIREFFAYMKNKKNSNSGATEIMRSLTAVLVDQQKTLARAVEILDEIKQTNSRNGERLESINMNLTIAMERQQSNAKAIEEIKTEVKKQSTTPH